MPSGVPVPGYSVPPRTTRANITVDKLLVHCVWIVVHFRATSRNKTGPWCDNDTHTESNNEGNGLNFFCSATTVTRTGQRRRTKWNRGGSSNSLYPRDTIICIILDQVHSLVLYTRRGSEISLNDFELHIFRCLCILFVLVLLLRLSQIQIAFFQFSLTHPNDCETNFVDVFGERTDIPTR